MGEPKQDVAQFIANACAEVMTSTGEPTYSVASDLSGVIETPDGIFKTKSEAIDYWIVQLEGEREGLRNTIARAKRISRKMGL